MITDNRSSDMWDRSVNSHWSRSFVTALRSRYEAGGSSAVLPAFQFLSLRRIYLNINFMSSETSFSPRLQVSDTKSPLEFDVCLSVHHRNMGRRNQLDVTQCFIVLVISSTCFGHVYTHHQELSTIMLVWHVACSSWLLVVGGSGAEQQAMRPE